MLYFYMVSMCENDLPVVIWWYLCLHATLQYNQYMYWPDLIARVGFIDYNELLFDVFDIGVIVLLSEWIQGKHHQHQQHTNRERSCERVSWTGLETWKQESSFHPGKEKLQTDGHLQRDKKQQARETRDTLRETGMLAHAHDIKYSRLGSS